MFRWKSCTDSRALKHEGRKSFPSAGCDRSNATLASSLTKSALKARLAPRRNHFSQSTGTEVPSQCKHLTGPRARQTASPESLVQVANSLAYTRASSSFCHRAPPLHRSCTVHTLSRCQARQSFLGPMAAPVSCQASFHPAIDVYPSNEGPRRASQSEGTVFSRCRVILTRGPPLFRLLNGEQVIGFLFRLDPSAAGLFCY